GGLPNSRMSAPAMKLRPAPTISTAATVASSCAASIAATRPRRTSTPSALTGGLSTVTTSTLPRCSRVTGDEDVEEAALLAIGGNSLEMVIRRTLAFFGRRHSLTIPAAVDRLSNDFYLDAVMDPGSLTLLVEIIDAGNLSEAARKLKMTRANVSYHLNQLERS